MSRYDFTEFPNITITGIDISSLNETELAILYAQARYCQAMTDAWLCSRTTWSWK